MSGFTLLELLVVIAIITILAAILFPVFASAREGGRKIACLSNQRQIGTAARMYMQDYDGSLFHHHEGWVLDDGTQLEQLPSSPTDCDGGGQGNSNAEKPWAIFFQPYIHSREVMYCPSDSTKRSLVKATNLEQYNGNITEIGDECSVNPESEQCMSVRGNRTMWSYLLNSIFTHRSCRYAAEGVLSGFATDDSVSSLTNPNIIMFSERNSVALDSPRNTTYGYVPQDDYDAWVGESALVRWGSGEFGDQGWIAHNRHLGGANYIYVDGHARFLKWSQARSDHYPDHVVRRPLENPPN